MNRIEMVKTYAQGIISAIRDERDKANAYAHTYGVAACCSLLAAKRGMNTEITSIMGLLHDLYSYKLNSYMCHQHSGSEMIRVTFKREWPDIFTDQEKQIILSAIHHHGDKTHVHDDYDEILKDADILDPFLRNGCLRVFNLALPRLEHMLKEIGISSSPVAFIETEQDDEPDVKVTDKRTMLADIAQRLAGKHIVGELTDTEFLGIIKYFPEDNAYDDLKSAWCAAFVYHCCVVAGFELPIKPARNTLRLACVNAWHEWAEAQGFCHPASRDFEPERGDIVIYNDVIPHGNKPEGVVFCDHIGVVLLADEGYIIAAEGNLDNNNISGIVKRKRDVSIGNYIRIPNDYNYNGGRYDYKTGELRVEKYETK